MEEFLTVFLTVGRGLGVTFQLLVGGLTIGVCLAIAGAFCRYNGVGARSLDRAISLLRGTPLILQLAFIYFSVPALLGLRLGVVSAGILAFGLNSFAYISEILRAGIESIPRGQFEAARVLQISSYAMWKDIILPQVMRNVLPAMMNEVITLLKETSLIATIGGMDVMKWAQMVAAEKFTYFMPLCVAGGYYYGLVLLIEYGGKKLEKRLRYA